MNTRQTQVFNYLFTNATGCDFPKTEVEVSQAVGINTVKAREAIRQLRLQGELIISGSKGYWIPSTPPNPLEEELARKYIENWLGKRAKKIFALLTPQMEAVENKFGIQLNFEM